MLAPADLLDRFGGIAHGTFLQGYGCSRRRLADHARCGEIQRVRVGVCASPTTDARILTAAAHGGALTGVDALRDHGVFVLPQKDPDEPDPVHVWMGARGRAHPHAGCECVPHYSPGRAGLGLAPVAVALIHAYRELDAEAFFAAYESAWNQRRISASGSTARSRSAASAESISSSPGGSSSRPTAG